MNDRRNELPPILARRGLKGMAPIVPVAALSMIYAVELHSWLAAAFAMPEMVDHEYDHTGLLNSFVVFVFLLARPTHWGQWLLLAVAAVLYQTGATLAWWGAINVLRYLEPEFVLGVFTGMLSLAAGMALGWLAFHAVHRLAGAHSPWRDVHQAMTGAPPA